MIETMAAAATEWLAALSAGQRAKAQLAFTVEGARVDWHYTPHAQSGLPLLEMDPGQQLLALRFVGTGLSDGGFAMASAIMGNELTLLMRERFRARPHPHIPGARFRDPALYFVTVFGEPGAKAWGWRFGGHHISLNYTVIDGRLVSPTPTFFGADPAEQVGVGGQRFRILPGEEDLGRELVHLLDHGQRETAIVAAAAPLDIVQANRPLVEEDALPIPLWELMAPLAPQEVAVQQAAAEHYRVASGLNNDHLEAVRHRREPAGLAAAHMNDAQRDCLRALIAQYIRRMPDELAEVELAELGARGLDSVHFTWAGGIERGAAHYYRLRGERFLVEYDNAQNNANHIHTVWRDPEGDFGRDLLWEHYAAEHA